MGSLRAALGVAAFAGQATFRLAAGEPMRLHMMTEKGLGGMGAVCLDGSDAGFYFAPAANPQNQNNWQIYFQGGGWCYDEMDCWARSNTQLGSSRLAGSQVWANASEIGGIMSDDCRVNPDFCNFNRVHMVYCDGSSFSGNREEPVNVTGLDHEPKLLYFRGRRIIDATLQTLLGMGLGQAENVLLTGCSAGGLATFLHADYVHRFLRSTGVPLKRYKAVPMSGFFLWHKTVEGKAVYPEEIADMFALSEATTGMNDRCIRALGKAEASLCNFAQFAYQYTRTPIFPVNSALDSWQSNCIYAAEFAPQFPNQTSGDNGECGAVQGIGVCAGDPEKCDEAEMPVMNQFITDFRTTIQSAGTYHKPGNGAFVHSCFTHCEAQQDAWNSFKANGVSMQEAVSKWWRSEGEPASSHSYDDSCMYNASATPHGCNPSCYGEDDPVDKNVVIT